MRDYYRRIGRTTPLIDAVFGGVLMGVGFMVVQWIQGEAVDASFDLGMGASGAVGTLIGLRLFRRKPRRTGTTRAEQPPPRRSTP